MNKCYNLDKLMSPHPIPVEVPVVISFKSEVGEFHGTVTKCGKFILSNGGEFYRTWYGDVSGWRHA